mgnify:FL=1
MASPQRSRQRRSAPSGPDPAARGIILVVVAVVLGAILLAAGGTVGFDQDDESVDIGEGGGGEDVTETTAPTETTTSAPVTVAPSQVAVVAANGAGISGLAGPSADCLATQGDTNTAAPDALADTAQTVVYYVDGFQPNAVAIAGAFGLPETQVQPLPAEPVAGDQPDTTAIVVLLGPDAEAAVSGGSTTTAPG